MHTDNTPPPVDPEQPDYTDIEFDEWQDSRLSRMGNDTSRDEPVFHGLD